MITKVKLSLSNAYIVQGEATILIDTGAPGEERKLIAALERQGIGLDEVRLILHTHVHSDHVGSTVALRQLADIPVAFHRADQRLAEQGHNGKLSGVGARGRIMAGIFNRSRFAAPAASFYLEDGMRLDDFGIAGVVRQTPGHTAGSVSLLLDDGAAIVGDVLMGGYMGGNIAGNRPMPHYFMEDAQQATSSLDWLLAQQLHTLYVGHGGPLAADRIRARLPLYGSQPALALA